VSAKLTSSMHRRARMAERDRGGEPTAMGQVTESYLTSDFMSAWTRRYRGASGQLPAGSRTSTPRAAPHYSSHRRLSPGLISGKETMLQRKG
jgi:hypothetical protein